MFGSTPRGPDKKPRRKALTGHAFQVTDRDYWCQCRWAGPWPKRSYSLAEAKRKHGQHVQRLRDMGH